MLPCRSVRPGFPACSHRYLYYFNTHSDESRSTSSPLALHLDSLARPFIKRRGAHSLQNLRCEIFFPWPNTTFHGYPKPHGCCANAPPGSCAWCGCYLLCQSCQLFLELLWSHTAKVEPFMTRRGVHTLQVSYFPMTSYYLSLLQQAILPPSNHCTSDIMPSRIATFIVSGYTKGFEDPKTTYGRIYLSASVVTTVVFCAATPRRFSCMRRKPLCDPSEKIRGDGRGAFGCLSIYVGSNHCPGLW